ncbi:hypothetical protein MLD38_014841 [Melastoma candidum]|uniref:Uncharacterized protein n=1 Tax=Melastoma candidum TaxID=119954 RepID=A0ACB9RHS2_9MYRT|nr:hypothetical protein MLD38_014841 [Melastoma candidum]
MEELSLQSLFEQARKIYDAASDSSVDQDLVRKGVDVFHRCEDMISKLGLFSPNESKDDISTVNLKYILVPFYVAELTEKVLSGDRIQILQSSLEKLKEFLSFCDAMELLSEEDRQMSMQAGVPNTLQDQRARKIARFKRQRAVESKLLEIKERKERRGRSTKAAALSAPVEVAEEDIVENDDEEEREVWLTTISLAICKALDLLEMLKKEEGMLSAIKERQEKGGEEFSRAVLDERAKTAEAWHKNASVKARYTKPAPPITCATFAQDVLEGRAKVSEAHEHKHQPLIFGPASLVNGSLTTEREQIAAKVFQPSYRMPTMSIEEAGLREMEIMQNFQERNAKLVEEANSAWYKDKIPKRGGNADVDEDEDDDAAQEKARAWDDWKDDNPRGAGNKKLTPCG